jgi:ribosomal protein L37AE/L43A
MNNLLTRQLIRCPAYAMYTLEMVGRRQARCSRCDISLDGPMRGTLLEIISLPVGLGRHACEECEHPEMKLLPGGVLHCPACRSEVVLLSRDGALMRVQARESVK